MPFTQQAMLVDAGSMLISPVEFKKNFFEML